MEMMMEKTGWWGELPFKVMNCMEFTAEQIRAGRYERSTERRTQRNGYRERLWETRVGEIPLRIPKLRTGSYFPSLLEPRRRYQAQETGCGYHGLPDRGRPQQSGGVAQDPSGASTDGLAPYRPEASFWPS
jgi:hypothetical protein